MPLLDSALPSRAARKLILQGRAPAGMRVNGHLDLSGHEQPLRLPAGLSVPSIDLSRCPRLTRLPPGLRVQHLCVNGCAELTAPPAGLQCEVLEACATGLQALPEDLQVTHKLDLSDCTRLTTLPRRLIVQTLLLCRCTALTALPEVLKVCVLDLTGCTVLTEWPASKQTQVDRLDLSGCIRLRGLPENVGRLAELNLTGCTSLRELPEGMQVSGWLDATGSGFRGLPSSLRGVRLRWRGVFVDERIVFRPESITAVEILAEANVERRRVLLERMGHERFFQGAAAEVLDVDRDVGGERRLLRVAMPWDEALVCVAVHCPSTGRQYLLRVPPATTTCKQAAAWLAGFDDPDAYHPSLET